MDQVIPVGGGVSPEQSLPAVLQLPRYHHHQQLQMQREQERGASLQTGVPAAHHHSMPPTYFTQDPAYAEAVRSDERYISWHPPSRRSLEEDPAPPPPMVMPYISSGTKRTPHRHVMRHRGPPPRPINPNLPPPPPKCSVGVQVCLKQDEGLRWDSSGEELPGVVTPAEVREYRPPFPASEVYERDMVSESEGKRRSVTFEGGGGGGGGSVGSISGGPLAEENAVLRMMMGFDPSTLPTSPPVRQSPADPKRVRMAV